MTAVKIETNFVSTSIPAISVNEAPSTKDRSPMVGMLAVMLAMKGVIPAVLHFSTHLMKLSVILQEINAEMTQGWAAVLKQDQDALEAEEASGDGDQKKAATISELSMLYNQHNLLSNQSLRFWTSLNDQVNNTSAASAKDVSVYLDIEEKGPAVLAAGLAQLLQHV